MDIIPYAEEHFDSLIAFLRKNWSENHSIYNKELFDWQYKGCSHSKPCGFVLTDKGAIVGFIGGVPYRFLCDTMIIEGCGFAVWIVDKTIKNSGIGLLLRRALEENSGMAYTIGLNLAVVKLYAKKGYTYYDEMDRYIMPLNSNGYRQLLVQPDNFDKIHVILDKEHGISSITPASSVDLEDLSRAYEKNIIPYFRLLPDKQKQFFSWRYVNSKGFKYLFFMKDGIYIIGRIESVHAPNDCRHGLKCFRIIEIIPNNGDIWNGKSDTKLADTIMGVLSWARENNCVLADFQISTSKIESFMKDNGFYKQGEVAEANVLRLFSPLRDVGPLNFAYRVKEIYLKSPIYKDDTYFLKSDCDMDRPNWLG